jgi:hypothetical protein
MAMRVLDQISKLCATLADGIVGARTSYDVNRSDRDRNERHALASDGRPVASTTQTARDDEKGAQPPSGSYPAVWPR